MIAPKLGIDLKADAVSLDIASLDMCNRLLSASMDKLTMLYFLVREGDIQSVYERLATREALISKRCYNSSPGVSMSESDLVRNLVTSYGYGEESQLALYREYWAPLEAQAEASAKRCNRSLSEVLNHFISAFVAQLTIEDDFHNITLAESSESRNASKVSSNISAWFDPGLKLFPMYISMKKCIYDALEKKGVSIIISEPTKETDIVIRSLLNELKTFGQDFSWQKGVSAVNFREIQVCPCYARGTLCTDCIIKNFAKK